MLSMRYALWPQQGDNASDLLSEEHRPRITVVGVGAMGSRMLQPLLHNPVAGMARLARLQNAWHSPH